MGISITMHSDEKGYLDRECPNEDCLYTFKIFMKDWKEKVSDEEVHCPMCGHVDTSDKWWTQEQLESMQNIAASYAMNQIQNKLDKAFGQMDRTTKNNNFVKITYKPGRRITFINNPIGQRGEWETEIFCERCETRYSVIGSAYFCPCCGYNSAVSSFKESMDSIEKMLDSLSDLRQLFTSNYGKDKAETMCRAMIESSIGDIVSAFQKVASCHYDNLTGLSSRVNDFQIVEKGSDLFEKHTGKGYSEWLDMQEINDMKILFQKRHILEHNDGMVDQKYIEKSGDYSYSLGQRIIVREKDARELLVVVKKLCDGLLSIKEAKDK